MGFFFHAAGTDRGVPIMGGVPQCRSVRIDGFHCILLAT